MQTNTILAQYKPISTYKPQIGDVIMYSGLIKHWSGVVNSYDPDAGNISILKGVIPYYVITAEQKDFDSIKIDLSINKIRSGSKTYAAIQAEAGTNVWYI